MKKLFYCLWIFVCSFVFINKVEARILTNEEVIEGFPNTDVIETLYYSGEVYVKDNTSESKLDIYLDDELIVSFNYTDEYYEYTDDTVYEMGYDGSFDKLFMISAFITDILNVSGYEGWEFKDDVDESMFTEDIYDTYGIYMELEEYTYTTDDYTSSGDIIRKVKITRDTDKIDKLMADYGQEAEQIDYSNVTASLKVDGATSNSVLVYPSVNNTQEGFFCELYISSDGENFTDTGSMYYCYSGQDSAYEYEGLESSTTYYFKTQIYGTEIYSPVVSVVTLAKSSASSSSFKNPSTGEFLNIAVLSGLALVGVAIILISKRKNKFKKI